MANLKQGSSGSDVKKMQQALIDAGYDVGSTGADGVFGNNTLSAVKKYQTDNGLVVDGIAGEKTLGKLYSTGSTNITATPATTTQNTDTGAGKNTFTTPAGNTYESFTYDEFTYDPFSGSDTLNQAWDTLGQLQGNAPGDWVDPYKDKYMGYLNQYENRDPFSYDFNSDALYQQYKDQYAMQGQLAMMDAMGQAASLSGGYGNSYAQTAGQMAYNQQLNQLNAIIPELYDRAYGIYQQEGQDLLNMYNAYLGLSDQSYNQYLGSVDNYYKQLGAASDYANTLYNKEYGEWSDQTRMDFDTWNANTGLSFDEWATKTGILSTENNTLMNQEFQAEENQKDRDFQASENAKSRSASAARSYTGNDDPAYKDMDIDTVRKNFSRLTTLQDIENYGDILVSEGYNPATVIAMENEAKSKLGIGGVVDTTVDASIAKGTAAHMALNNLAKGVVGSAATAAGVYNPLDSVWKKK